MIHTFNLTARYPVELVKRNKAHFYKVTHKDVEYEFPGTTGILNIIGGEKTPRLIGWNKKKALDQVREHLKTLPLPNDGIKYLRADVIDKIIEAGRKKPVDDFENAGKLGTRFHSYADQVIKGLPITEVADDLMNPILAFSSWLKESGINIIQGDTAVASMRHRFGGSFDFIFEKGGLLGVGDFKTSNGIWKEHSVQVAAYMGAADEMYDQHFEHGLIIRFDKQYPIYDYEYIDKPERRFEAFLTSKKLKELMAEDCFKKKEIN